jgi:short-subunit dehydrogenase
MVDKVAIVTGASKGIGKACVSALLSWGYRVHGISRTQSCYAPNYVHHSCDLSQQAEVERVGNLILEQESSLDLLLNNAGLGFFRPHEELSVCQLQEMISVNFTAPIVLTKLFLRALKKSRGTVVFISSISGRKRSHLGAAYAATKAGVGHFSQCLFEELRRSGVRSVELVPDFVKTQFFDELSFAPVDSAETVVQPEAFVHALKFVLEQPVGTVVSEMVVRPQRLQLEKKR